MSKIKPLGFKVQQKPFGLHLKYRIFDLVTEKQIFRVYRKLALFSIKFVIVDSRGQLVAKCLTGIYQKYLWLIIAPNDKIIGELRIDYKSRGFAKFEIKIGDNVYHSLDTLKFSYPVVDKDGNTVFKIDWEFHPIKDTYTVEVYPPFDPIYALITTIALDKRYFR